MKRDKINDLNLIKQAAKLYEENLMNKNVLLIYLENNEIEYYEVTFLKEHFKHLSGVKTKLNAYEFSYKARKNRLKLQDFDYKDSTTGLKLDNLIKFINLNFYAKMIGNFKQNKVYLSITKLAGNNNIMIGFDEGEKINYPKTLLKGDIRDYTLNPNRIIGILTKDVKDFKYQKLTYIAKNISTNRILSDKKLKELLNISMNKQEKEKTNSP